MSKMSTTARDELVGALARRYAVGTRAEKTRILDEFQAVTGFHRKHAMRVLRSCATRRRAEGKAGRRIYDDAVRDALVILWEASDRICGKRLKALIPTLVEAMERHGHLRLGPEIRAGLLAMSAATIDRSLREVRERAGGRSRRRAAPPSSVRRSIPVRTFSDWDDPAPGFAAADLVAHSGPVTRGSFVQTLVVTDIATGWTECAPVLYREQTLLREVLGAVRRLMPFELLGFDTDNDSVFINETLRDYCRDAGIVFTRCRPWRKNDQAFVEGADGHDHELPPLAVGAKTPRPAAARQPRSATCPVSKPPGGWSKETTLTYPINRCHRRCAAHLAFEPMPVPWHIAPNAPTPNPHRRRRRLRRVPGRRRFGRHGRIPGSRHARRDHWRTGLRRHHALRPNGRRRGAREPDLPRSPAGARAHRPGVRAALGGTTGRAHQRDAESPR